MNLTAQQNTVMDKIKAFMDSDASIFILRGYAGTGKTTMVKVVADYLSTICNPLLMAPTGRAARVLGSKTGRDAATIHKTIYSKACIVHKNVSDIAESEFKYVFPIREPKGDGRHVTIVDEASMVSSRNSEHELFCFGTDNIMNDLLTFVRPSFGGKIIFVGDPAQLPPVGENVSNALDPEFFRSKGLKVVEAELTEVLRQGKDSLILKNAMMIRDLLQHEKRNTLVFEERQGDVETIQADKFIDKYMECRSISDNNDSVIISFSNKTANGYNRDIRTVLYGSNAPIRPNDKLMIVQNNYNIGLMNGDFTTVLSVGNRIQQSAPVYVQHGTQKERVVINMVFVQVSITGINDEPVKCLLLEDLLTNDEPTLSIDKIRALYINFCMRNPTLKPGSEAFTEALLNDPFYNALRAKYGYAVTGHKCQGGEWDNVLVDYTGRSGMSDDHLRWAYTATTRARRTLYVANLVRTTPFSKFRIDPIQKCHRMPEECQVSSEVGPTPFHDVTVDAAVRAKYFCIRDNMSGTPYSIHSVQSKPYLEIYQIQTPDGIERYDLFYKKGAVFTPARTAVQNKHREQILLMLDSERRTHSSIVYNPSDDTLQQLYTLISSSCRNLSIQITNVVEHLSEYFVTYYFRTSNTFSLLKVYVNDKGFITYAAAMSMAGPQDAEFAALINEIKNNLN